MSDRASMDAATPAPAEGSASRRPLVGGGAGRFGLLPYLCVLVGMSLPYALTAQRGVSWQDSGKYQWRVLEGQYVTEGGLALAHPLYIAIAQVARLIPMGDLATRLNVMSGVWMALALANLSAVVALLTGRRSLGVLTAVMLGLLHTPWWLGTIAETYTMSAAAFTAEIWLLMLLLGRPRPAYLVALGLVAGLHASVHNLGLLATPVYLAVAVWLVGSKRLRAWTLAGAGAAYLLGAGPLLWLIGRQIAAGETVAATLRSALVGNYSQAVLNTKVTGQFLMANAAISAMNLLSPLVMLAVLGWLVMPRRLLGPVWLAIVAITAIHIAFVARYNIPDQFTFLLPSLVMLAVAAGVGTGWLADRWPGRRRAMLVLWALAVAAGPLVLVRAPDIAGRFRPDAARDVARPFRDELRYWLVPWKHDEHSAELFARSALEQAQPDGIIVADSTSVYPLMVLQRQRGLWPGVGIQYRNRPIPAGADADEVVRAAGDRPVYLVNPRQSGLPDRLAQWGTLRKFGVLWLWLPAGRG